MKKTYDEFKLLLIPIVVENAFLSTSVFEKSDVRSTGQEVESHNFELEPFSHEWGSEATY
ncbi:MAG: hypothetical protein MJY60_04330 [Bacteroidales bacterium]|nr:hypothetical protein [Bacteroidales bacterium]